LLCPFNEQNYLKFMPQWPDGHFAGAINERICNIKRGLQKQNLFSRSKERSLMTEVGELDTDDRDQISILW